MDEWFSSDANFFHFMRVTLMVSVCTAMYSNNYESCVYVFGVCGWSVVSQAWENSGGGIKKSKTQNAKARAVFLSSPTNTQCKPSFLFKIRRYQKP